VVGKQEEVPPLRVQKDKDKNETRRKKLATRGKQDMKERAKKTEAFTVSLVHESLYAP
jgi:hypothetical protein